MMVQWLITKKEMLDLSGYIDKNKVQIREGVTVYLKAVYPVSGSNSYYISWDEKALSSDDECKRILKCVSVLTGVNFKLVASK